MIHIFFVPFLWCTQSPDPRVAPRSLCKGSCHHQNHTSYSVLKNKRQSVLKIFTFSWYNTVSVTVVYLIFTTHYHLFSMKLNLIIPCAKYKNQAYCKIQCYHNVSGLFMIQYKVSEIKPNKKIFSTTILEANYKLVILFREGYCLSTSLKRMEISNTLHAVNRHFWMIALICRCELYVEWSSFKLGCYMFHINHKN